MNKYKDKFKRAINEANDRNSREKALVTQEFNNLRSALTMKEKQIIRDLDSLHKDNIVILSGFIETVAKIYEDIEKSKKEIEAILRRDEVMIFE